MDGSGDRERFAAHLRAQGEDEATIEAYLRIADRVVSVAGSWAVRPKHVDEAMRRAEAEGAQPQQLSNLKRVGDALVAFVRASPPPVASAAPAAAAVIGSHRCPVCGGGFALAQPAANGAATSIGGGVGAVGGFIGVRLLGCFGMMPVLLGIGAAGAAYRALTLRARCTSCAFVASPEHLDASLQDELDGARRKSAIGAVAMGIGAVVAFVLWIGMAVALAPR